MPSDFANYRPIMFLYDPKKVSKNGYHHAASDTCFTSDGKPLIPPVEPTETALGRWELSTGDAKRAAGVHVDVLADQAGRGPGNPEHGELSLATVFAGRARCLVTDRALRFTGYAHRMGMTLEWKEPILAFSVPLAAITSLDPGKSNPFMTTSKWFKIELGDLGATISVSKVSKANEKFGVSPLATNKSKEFGAQIEEARRRLASLGVIPGD
jgi:hypothetical protein